jgi:hypothetical protein
VATFAAVDDIPSGSAVILLTEKVILTGDIGQRPVF